MKFMELEGKTALVTGATSGIGEATAIDLARRGARVAVLCRNEDKGRAVLASIARETGRDHGMLFVADLASQEQIRGVVPQILDACERLDLLVNNAGVVNTGHTRTEDGIENTFAVNHLAYFLLTLLLLDRIVESAPARIVNVASDAHRFVRGIDFEDLGHERSFWWPRVYGQSKLANILFTRELARRLEGTGVTVNAVHPGAVATGLGSNNGGWASRIMKFAAPLFRSPDKGAETSIWAATDPSLARTTGGYFANCRPGRLSSAARDDALALRLWSVSEELTGRATTGAGGNV
jgi:retinol dehydrogenase-12